MTTKELEALQAFATLLLGYGEDDLAKATEQGELVELEIKGHADEDR